MASTINSQIYTTSVDSTVSFGVRRRAPEGREVFVPSSFSQVGTLLEQEGARMEKLRDIANLPITEIVEIRPRQQP